MKQAAALEKVTEDFIELDRRYTRLENESNVYIKGLEEEKNTLQKRLDLLGAENQELGKAETGLKVALENAKEAGRDKLKQQHAEFEFQTAE